MAVAPEDLDSIAATVAALYREAETALVRLIGRHLAGDLDSDMQSPAWADKKLAAVSALRRSAQAVIAGLQATTSDAVRAAAATAFQAGWTSALAELPKSWFPESGIGQAAQRAAEEVPAFAAIEALAAAVHRDVGERSHNILRDVLDVYRNVITATVARTLTGVQTRREASQAAWKRLRDKGITGFTDRAGRRWQLSTYVEMAVRTVTQRAAVAGQTARLDAAGVQLVLVSNAPQECVLCRPFEGRVLRITPGPTGRITFPHQLTDEPVTVEVLATLPEAQLRGLFHPQCRHSVSAYLPGVTQLPPQPTADPGGDQARQQQRAIERAIRRAKMDEVGALGDTERKAAGRKVRALQGKLRDHLAANPDLKRLRYREQIGAGNIPPAGRGDAAGSVGPVPPQLDLDGNPVPNAPTRRTDSDEDAPPAADPNQLSIDDVTEPVDVTTLTDAELDDAFTEATDRDDAELIDAVLAEMDRRQAEAEPVDPHAEQWARVDELVAAGVDERTAYAEAFGKDTEQVRREDAIQRLRDDGNTGRGFDELARSAYRKELQHQYFEAEAATNGFLLTPAGQRAGLDPLDLWRQNEAYARKWASDELKQWWDNNGRLTFDQFAAELLSGQNEQRFRTGGESWLQ